MEKALVTALATTLQISCAIAGVPRAWDADVGSPAAFQTSAWQGETVELAAQLVRGRKPFAIPEGATAGLWWKTNGMDRYWGPAPATVSTNGVVSASWVPTNDVGAASYRGFLGVSLSGDGSNRTYAANFTLRMLESPGFAPNSLPLPVRTLDFATVEVSNAPWLTEEADPTVPAWAKADTPPLTEESDPIWEAEKGWYATTDALSKVKAVSGFTAWEAVDMPEGWRLDSTYWENAQWCCRIVHDSDPYLWEGSAPGAPIDGTNAMFGVYVGGFAGGDDVVYFDATRKRPLAKTSNLRNDGEDGTSPYTTQSQVEGGWWSEWVCDPAQYHGKKLRVIYENGGWLPFSDAHGIVGQNKGDSTSSELSWTNNIDSQVSLTATRHYVPGLADYVSKTKKELHADSATNVVWQNVYSNGWVFLKAYTNELSEAY